MFNNPDFHDVPNGCMFVTNLCTYDMLYEFSRVLGIPWIDVALDTKGRYSSPALNPDYSSVFFVLIFLFPALYLSIKRCVKRIRNKEISLKDGVKAYIKSLGEHFVVLLLLILVVPIVIPYLRGWKSIF